MAVSLCGAVRLDWAHLISAYQEESGRFLDADGFVSILAMNYFYHHIRIARYGWWDGSAEKPGQVEASASLAEQVLAAMQSAHQCLREP